MKGFVLVKISCKVWLSEPSIAIIGLHRFTFVLKTLVTCIPMHWKAIRTGSALIGSHPSGANNARSHLLAEVDR